MIKQRLYALLRLLTLAAGATVIVPHASLGQEVSDPSPRISLSGSHHTRYEHLQNEFRPGLPGNDMALSLRTSLLAELRFGVFAAGVELVDSRVYLADDNTPLNTSHVNPVDVLQAYVTVILPNVVVDGSRLRINIGRQTMDAGSRRFVARNRFRNTINAFTGLELQWTGPNQQNVRGFVTVPVERRVSSIPDNEPKLDIERREAVFWGVLLGSRVWQHEIRAELQVFGLHEHDSEEHQATNRNLVTPGFRIHRSPETGLVDFEIESVVQAGTSRLSALPDDTEDLSHLAFFAHAEIGRTFDGMWQPRLVFLYDYASGDQDPTDGNNGRFDTMFGARRFDFGPTGIYGPIARSNIKSPGVRVEVSPTQEVNGFFGYRSVWLAQSSDAWTTTGIRDIEGTSGSFLGHQIEGRARWRLLPNNITFEAGFAHIWMGAFPRNAPNGNPDLLSPTFIYTQVALQI